MNRLEAIRALGESAIGHLATTRPDGRPHVVPITFALTGGRIVTMIDHKPKTTSKLQRLANIEANPGVSVLADHYSDDWSELWWVRADGRAEIHLEGDPWSQAVEALSVKYEQYRDRPPRGPAIVISVDRVTSWQSTP